MVWVILDLDRIARIERGTASTAKVDDRAFTLAADLTRPVRVKNKNQVTLYHLDVKSRPNGKGGIL
jgi:hypothetical protein